MARRRGSKPKIDDELARTREAPATLPRLALLAAAEAVITDKGFARATVEDVAAYAGVAVDVVYAHFGGKGALLRALCDHFAEQMLGVADQADEAGDGAASPHAILDAAIRAAIDVVHDHAAVVRAILAHGDADPTLAGALRRIGQRLATRVAQTIRTSRHRDADAVDEREIAFALLTALALAHHAILVGDDSTGVPFPRAELADEASRALAAYLGGAARRGRAGLRTDGTNPPPRA